MEFNKFFNKLNERKGFTRLDDLNLGEPYLITRLDVVTNKFGIAIMATLDCKGETFSVYLPKRFTIDPELVEKYNSKDSKKMSLVYFGLQRGRHEMKFV
jgi:hypothetical protein